MLTIRRALTLLLLAVPAVAAQAQASIAEARVVELGNMLRLGRRDSLAAFIARSRQNPPDAAEMKVLLNYYHGFFHTAQGAQISARDVNPYSAAAIWYSPLLEEWYATSGTNVDPDAPHLILGMPRISRVPPPGNAPAPAARAKSPQAAWQAVDAYVKRLTDADQFSGTVLVALGSQVVGVKSYGQAVREFDIPNTPDTRMIFGSIGKMFTAVSVLQLVEEGKLSLDDPLVKHLPGVIAAPGDSVIRVKHLLTHTSGLGDFLFVPQMMSANRAKYRSVGDFLPLLKDDTPSFAPGTRWRYSNTGFLLLGAILEKVEGIPYDSVIARRVFRRAGMTDTENLDLDLVPKRIAYTYVREFTESGQERWRSDRFEHPVHGTPAGGGWTTARDLARFADALRGNKLLSADMTAQMLSPKPDLSSPMYGYGAQLFGTTGNLVGHTGSGHGTAAVVQFDKTTGLTAVVISNTAGQSGAIVRRIFATFPTS